MLSKKKHPDYDNMSKEEKLVFIKKEIAQDLERGDRYALTRICEMWHKEEILNGLFDAKNIDTPKWSPKLKLSSMKFVLDLWDKWDNNTTNQRSNSGNNE